MTSTKPSAPVGFSILLAFIFTSFLWTTLFTVFPGPSVSDERIAHRVICEYLGGEQQGKVCIRDGRVVEVDLTFMEK